jgi:hypothetical protein
MNIEVVKNALGSLDKLLSQAKQALRDIEIKLFGGPGGGYAEPRDAMKWFLEELHDVLLVVLEAADMPETRASLIKAWRGFIDKKGLGHTNDNPEYDHCESPALTFLDRMIQGLRMSVSEVISSEEAWTLSKLEAILRSTHVLVHRRESAPAREADLQKIMHDYLHAFFLSDFRTNFTISGAVKNFKPDCGIWSVSAAIEFKIVHTKDEAPVAVSGVIEDTAGYRGSKDWTRFYSVIYQAEPFMSEEELQSDLKRTGAESWTPIVVNGRTGNRAKKTSGKAVSGHQSGQRAKRRR